MESRVERNIHNFKASENGKFQSCCEVRCITSGNISGLNIEGVG